MKIVSIRDFRDHATKMFRSNEAILVTKNGHVSGLYFPSPQKTLPLEIKKEALLQLMKTIQWKGATKAEEKDVMENFIASRKNRS